MSISHPVNLHILGGLFILSYTIYGGWRQVLKRFLYILLILFAFSAPSEAVVQSVGGTCLTGGTIGCLDSYNGSTLSDGDVATIVSGGYFRVYLLDADSAAASVLL